MKVGIWEGFPEEVMQSEFLIRKDSNKRKKKKGRKKEKEEMEKTVTRFWYLFHPVDRKRTMVKC